MMMSEEFLKLAKELTSIPTDAAQRRAISTSYYAVFHRFSEQLTEGLLGFSKPASAGRELDDWLRVYRGIEHTALDKSTEAIARASEAGKEGVATLWRELHSRLRELRAKRHAADYDPSFKVGSVNIARTIYEDANTAILILNTLFDNKSADLGQARRLAIEVLLKVKDRK